MYAIRSYYGVAAEAQSAIEAIRAVRPDVVLLDLHLAEGNGFEVLRALRARITSYNVCYTKLLRLAPWEAALGTAIEIPTLDSRVTLKIPPGSRSGQRLRLAGMGLPKPAGGAGDLYAVLSIALPETLSTRERELYEQLRDASRGGPAARGERRGA